MAVQGQSVDTDPAPDYPVLPYVRQAVIKHLPTDAVTGMRATESYVYVDLDLVSGIPGPHYQDLQRLNEEADLRVACLSGSLRDDLEIQIAYQ